MNLPPVNIVCFTPTPEENSYDTKINIIFNRAKMPDQLNFLDDVDPYQVHLYHLFLGVENVSKKNSD